MLEYCALEHCAPWCTINYAAWGFAVAWNNWIREKVTMIGKTISPYRIIEKLG